MEDTFSTYQLEIAAVLMLFGKELLDITVTPRSKGKGYGKDAMDRTFIFKDETGCKALYEGWKNGMVRGNLRDFMEARATLKTLSDDARNGHMGGNYED